ncbi:hypothetical protein [Acinetobacter venetianus]|uniref:hypothetical protein n=1 Tax=Acinetobacter venetianus TaxID=52133 RepID=UPI00214FD06A|nr:hypothetical protein [Acinetobacter venetianus]MCR4532527.1 hypothetical protein [Acinetobacter venetianus]
MGTFIVFALIFGFTIYLIKKVGKSSDSGGYDSFSSYDHHSSHGYSSSDSGSDSSGCDSGGGD